MVGFVVEAMGEPSFRARRFDRAYLGCIDANPNTTRAAEIHSSRYSAVAADLKIVGVAVVRPV